VIKLPPDITFVIQLVAFVVLWQVLRVVLFVPMQKALKVRAERTEGSRMRAEALLAEAAQIEASIQAGLAEAKKDGALRADEIRRRAETEEHAILARYRGQAAALLERERALTDAQISSARAPLEAEAARLAGSIVQQVLGRAA
jgi:F-type H+-transporting ATPase subunit b